MIISTFVLIYNTVRHDVYWGDACIVWVAMSFCEIFMYGMAIKLFTI